MTSQRFRHLVAVMAAAMASSACGGGSGPDPIDRPDPPDPLRIEAISPTYATSPPRSRVLPIPVVRVRNSKGPREHVPVAFHYSSGATDSVRTNTAGEARIEQWIAPDAGQHRLVAKVSATDSVVFIADVVPAVPAHILFEEAPGPTPVGTVTSDVVVWIVDTEMRPAAGLEVHFTVESGGGTLTGAVATTNILGRARLGSWTLGPSAALQQLRASAAGLTNVFDVYGAPARFEAASDTVQRGHTGKPAPVAPAVRAIDALGQPMPDVPVAFVQPPTVSGHPSFRTGADGIVRFTDWVAAFEPGDNLVAAETFGWPSRIEFRLIGVVPGPARVEILSGGNQRGYVGNFLGPRPAVRFFDSTDVPIRLLPTTWTTTGGTTLQHQSVATDYAGISAAEGWRLGPTPGPVSVTVSADGIAPVTWTAEAEPLPAGRFDIDIRIIDTPGLTAEDSAEVLTSSARWTKVLRTDLPPVTITETDSVVCGDRITGTIDDLLINVIIQHIDGPGNIIGSAAPCVIRAASMLPAVGLVTLDAADFVGIRPGLLGDAMAHQIGHILGIGTLWTAKGLINGVYTGPFARTAYHGLAPSGETFFSHPSIPISGGDVPGNGPFSRTVGHWVGVGAEMMGMSVERGIALSAISIAGLRDLGYTASDAEAEPLNFPSLLRSLMGSPTVAGYEVMPNSGLWVVDQSSRLWRVPSTGGVSR